LETEQKLKEILENKPKRKSRLEEDSIIDWDLIGSFVISAIVHIIVFSSLWLVLFHYNESHYRQLVKSIGKKPHADIIFHLVPGTDKDGEIGFKETKQFIEQLEVIKPDSEINKD
jgi:magnesium-transporting ATPase (P-type)